MKKWHLIIDVAKCFDCNNCFLSCKDEFDGNDFPPYSLAQPKHGHRWMNIMRKERGQYPKVDVAYRPTPCMHCDDAPCIKQAGDGAVYKRDDGIVLVDPQKAENRKDIPDSCPYGAMGWNDEKAIPQMCTFCVHLLEDGRDKPRCVQACPSGALTVLHAEDGEMAERIQTEELEVLHPEYRTKPRVYYRNLYRYVNCFIAGNVACKDTDECAEGAKVSLKEASGKAVAEVGTDNYGDFKFDNLEEGSGPYSLIIEYPGYEKREMSVELEKSINLGTIFI